MRPDDMASRAEGEEGFRELQRSGGAGAGVPPIGPVFPAVAARPNRVQSNGRKRMIVQSQLTLDDFLP